MKKLLAMVLALVMTLSLAVSANAFKDDKSISDDYAEAVAVLNGMGVFKGYEDGSFQPKGNITRAEVSAIVYRVYTQDVKDAKASMYATYNKFSDMAGAGWAQGYIGYCANAELVKGYPDGTFKPSGKVTGYEVLAMILRATTRTVSSPALIGRCMLRRPRSRPACSRTSRASTSTLPLPVSWSPSSCSVPSLRLPPSPTLRPSAM